MNSQRLSRPTVRFTVFLVVFMLLVALLPAAEQVQPGKTRLELLHRDTAGLLLEMDTAAAPACGRRTVVEGKAILPETLKEPAGDGEPVSRRQERWYVDRCGRLVSWDVRYLPSDLGGTGVIVGLAPGGDGAPSTDSNAAVVPFRGAGNSNAAIKQATPGA